MGTPVACVSFWPDSLPLSSPRITMAFFSVASILFILYGIYKTTYFLLYRYVLRSLTAVDDLKLLGPRKGPKLEGTALICGGRYESHLTLAASIGHSALLLVSPVYLQPESWRTIFMKS